MLTAENIMDGFRARGYIFKPDCIDYATKLMIKADDPRTAVAIIDNNTQEHESRYTLDVIKKRCENLFVVKPDILYVLVDYIPRFTLYHLPGVIQAVPEKYIIKHGAIKSSLKPAYIDFLQITKELKAREGIINRRCEFDELEERTVIATFLIMLINIAIYFKFHSQMDAWAFSKKTFESGDYLRMLSYMFMHGGILHLIGNTICLYFAGTAFEHQYGWFKFLVVYITGGYVAAEFSARYNTSPDIMTIGASGAICAIIGGCIAGALFEHKEFRRVSISMMFMWFGVIMLSGYISPDVDNMAHLGGFIGGYFVMSILKLITLISRSKRTIKYYEQTKRLSREE